MFNHRTIVNVLLIVLLNSFFWNAVCIASDSYANTFIKHALNLKLSEDKTWHALNHYRFKPFTGKLESYIDDDSFFIADNGKYSAQDELIATIRAFTTPEAKNESGEYYRCRYQARYKWLKSILDFNAPFNVEENCPIFHQWYKTINPGKVTLIYPTSYINSPSSMFGHTLLRIDPPDSQQRADLVSWAINFGADIGPDSEQDLFYAYKGLAGGYPGRFVVMPYHKKVKEYSKIENRDIWEYSLNLSIDETRFMMLHLWEINTKNFDYFYLDENCSFRLLELLDVARPSLGLTQSFPVFAIPNDTVRAIVNSGLVNDKKYRPSSVNQIKNKLALLEKKEKYIVKQLSTTDETLQAHLISSSEDKHRLIFDTAYQHLRYQQVGKDRDNSAAKRSWELLSMLNKTSIGSNQQSFFVSPISPESGHHSYAVASNIGKEHNQNYIGLRARPGYHSLIDNQHGFLKGAEINFLDIDIRIYEDDDIEINRFDIFRIISLSPYSEFFPDWSWKVSGGIENVITSSSYREQSTFVEAGGGIAFEHLDNHLSYALVSARTEYNNSLVKNTELLTGMELGYLWYQSFGVMQISLMRDYLNRNEENRNGIKLIQSFHMNQNLNLKLLFSKTQSEDIKSNDAQIAITRYF